MRTEVDGKNTIMQVLFFVGSLYRTDNLTHFKDADDEEQENSCKSLTPPLKV